MIWNENVALTRFSLSVLCSAESRRMKRGGANCVLGRYIGDKLLLRTRVTKMYRWLAKSCSKKLWNRFAEFWFHLWASHHFTVALAWFLRYFSLFYTDEFLRNQDIDNKLRTIFYTNWNWIHSIRIYLAPDSYNVTNWQNTCWKEIEHFAFSV